MATIHFNDNQFFVNDTLVTWPLSVSKLQSILGTGRYTKPKYNHVYAWDDQGISAFSNDNKLIDSISLELITSGLKFRAGSAFTGRFTIGDTDMLSYFEKNKNARVKLFPHDTGGAFIFGAQSVWFDFNDKVMQGINISPYEPPPVKKTLPVDPSYHHYTMLWRQWIDAVTSIVPANNVYYNLTQGIAQEDLDNLPEAEGFGIPDIVSNFYKVADVYYEPVASPFTFRIHYNQFDLIPFADIYRHWSSIQDLCDIKPDADTLNGYPPAINTTAYANPRWIPFAEDRGGDYLLVDTDPGKKGVFGQIIELQNESWSRDVVANTLEALVQQQIIDLGKNNDYMQFFVKER